MSSLISAPTPANDAKSPTTNPEEKEKVHDKSKLVWDDNTERMLAGWADVAQGYYWLHSSASRKYESIEFAFSVPISIFSTLTGVVSVSMATLVPTEYVDLGQKVVGGVNVFTGILTYFQSKYKFSQKAESHRHAAVGWSKLLRNMKVELDIARLKRKDADTFIKVCRSEYDRLIEQSPDVPKDSINKFKRRFGHINDLVKPDVCDNIMHTKVIEPDVEPEPYVEPVFDTPERKPDVENLLTDIKQILSESRLVHVGIKDQDIPFPRAHYPNPVKRDSILKPDFISPEIKPRPSFLDGPPPLIKLNSQVEVSRPSVRDLKKMFEASFKPVLTTSSNVQDAVVSIQPQLAAAAVETGASSSDSNLITELEIVIEDSIDDSIDEGGSTPKATPSIVSLYQPSSATLPTTLPTSSTTSSTSSTTPVVSVPSRQSTDSKPRLQIHELL